jgi:hypothetical protein
MIACKAD